MASLAMAAPSALQASASSFVGSNFGNAAPKQAPSSVKMMAPRCQTKENEDMQRRAVITGLAAGVMAMVAGVNAAHAVPKVAPGEPKPGSKDALKKYANICVSNPKASICHG